MSAWKQYEVDKVAQGSFTSYYLSLFNNCCLWLSNYRIWQLESLQLMLFDDYNWCYISGQDSSIIVKLHVTGLNRHLSNVL